MTGFAWLLPWLLAMLLAGPVARANDFELIKPSVVRIFSKGGEGRTQVGTGFVVQVEGETAFIVTASHVVEGDPAPQVEFYSARNKRYKAEIGRLEGDDPRGIAYLVVRDRLIAARRIAPLPFMAEGNLKGGDEVFLMGFGQGQGDWAIIRATVASIEGRNIRLDGRVEPGNSGGPVLHRGQVAGVVTQTRNNFGIASPAMVVNLTLKGWGVETALGSALKFDEVSKALEKRGAEQRDVETPRKEAPAPLPVPAPPVAALNLNGQFVGRSFSRGADGQQYVCDMATVFSHAGNQASANFQNNCGDYGVMQGVLTGNLYNGQLNSASVGYCQVSAQVQQGGAVMTGQFQCVGLTGSFSLSRVQ